MTSVALRTDSSTQIGGGHVMRSLALAGELKQLGADVRFICRDLPGNLNELLGEQGYKLDVLPATIDSSADADATLAALDAPTDWMAVDHYELGLEWEHQIKQTSAQLLAIDDLASRPHDCDILLDQNVTDEGGACYDALVPAACRKLLGPAFAMLRPEFPRERRRLRPRTGALQRVLLFFGSADGAGQTTRVLRSLARPALADLHADVVVGAANRRADEVRALCSTLPGATFHLQADNMAELIASADLAIGAGGSTTWERCCLGLPALLIVCAENQRAPAQTAALTGAAINLGTPEQASEDAITQAVLKLRADGSRLAAMSAAGMRLVDGNGARRVAEEMLGFSLALAGPQDAEQIWRWANDPVVRVQSFDSTPIPWESHLQWYRNRLSNPDCLIYIARLNRASVGQVRFELRKGSAMIDVSVDPAWRGRGIGVRMLEAGLAAMHSRCPDVKAVAQVKAENSESMALFTAAAFTRRADRPDGIVEFEWTALKTSTS